MRTLILGTLLLLSLGACVPSEMEEPLPPPTRSVSLAPNGGMGMPPDELAALPGGVPGAMPGAMPAMDDPFGADLGMVPAGPPPGATAGPTMDPIATAVERCRRMTTIEQGVDNDRAIEFCSCYVPSVIEVSDDPTVSDIDEGIRMHMRQQCPAAADTLAAMESTLPLHYALDQE